MSARMPGNPNVYRSHGPRTGRPFSLDSQTTTSVSGLLSHKNYIRTRTRGGGVSRNTSDFYIPSFSQKLQKNSVGQCSTFNVNLSYTRNPVSLIPFSFVQISRPFRVIPSVQSSKINFHVLIRHIKLQFWGVGYSCSPTVAAVQESIPFVLLPRIVGTYVAVPYTSPCWLTRRTLSSTFDCASYIQTVFPVYISCRPPLSISRLPGLILLAPAGGEGESRIPTSFSSRSAVRLDMPFKMLL